MEGSSSVSTVRSPRRFRPRASWMAMRVSQVANEERASKSAQVLVGVQVGGLHHVLRLRFVVEEMEHTVL